MGAKPKPFWPGIPEKTVDRIIRTLGRCREDWTLELPIADEMDKLKPRAHRYEVPERVRKFQVGWQYRLPLWELVYHDCVVAQWYWGDYNNKLPAIWDLRDLFNLPGKDGQEVWTYYGSDFVVITKTEAEAKTLHGILSKPKK